MDIAPPNAEYALLTRLTTLTQDLENIDLPDDTTLLSSVLFKAKENFLYNLLYRTLRGGISCSELREVHSTEYKSLKKRAQMRLSLFSHMCSKLSEMEVPFTVIKGPVIAEMLYEDSFDRNYSDIDIIVASEDFNRANRLFIEQGGVSAFGDNFEELDYLDAYEAPYLFGTENLKLELKVATSSIRDVDVIRAMCARGRIVEIAGIKVNTFSINDTFLLLCTNLFGNIELEFAKLKYRDFLDLHLFLTKFQSEIEFDVLVSDAQLKPFVRQVYAVVNLTERMFDVVYGKVLNILRPLLSSDELKHDGWIRDWKSNLYEFFEDRTHHLEEMYYLESVNAYRTGQDAPDFNKANHSTFQIINDFYQVNIKGEVKIIGSNLKMDIRGSLVSETARSGGLALYILIHDASLEQPRLMVRVTIGNDKSVEFNNTKFRIGYEKNNPDVLTSEVDISTLNSVVEFGAVAYRVFLTRILPSQVEYALKDHNNAFDSNEPKLVYLP